jgi:transcription initiation factor TFIIIB Brf1 subunit/transcription initiation factor TFIIB
VIEVFQCPKCKSFDIEYDIETSKIICKTCGEIKKNTIDFTEYSQNLSSEEKEKYNMNKIKAFQKGKEDEC